MADNNWYDGDQSGTTQDPEPAVDPSNNFTPPPAAGTTGAPYSQDELSESQNWANQYFSGHQIPTSWGAPSDLANIYTQQRLAGASHADAMAAMQNGPNLNGWAAYTPPGTPPPTGGPNPPPVAPPPNPGPGSPAPAPTPAPGGGNSTQGSQNFGSIFDQMTAAAGTRGGNGAPAGVSQALYDQLLQRAHQGEKVDSEDPNIKQQMDPYSAQTERSRRDYVDALAEARGPMASIEGEKRLSYERAGQQNGMFQSQLIGRELQAKRDEIQQALTQLGAQMTADQQQELSKELGVLNGSLQKYGIDSSAKLQQEGIDSNNDQFAARFGLDSQNQASYWDNLRRGGRVN